MIEQIPFDVAPLAFRANDLAENPAPRCPCVLILDGSSSMDAGPIRELRDGLADYKDGLAASTAAANTTQ